jgi:hypothetical protein
MGETGEAANTDGPYDSGRETLLIAPLVVKLLVPLPGGKKS